MLKQDSKVLNGRSKAERRARRKWHDEIRNVPSMGCASCPEYKICGGLKVTRPLFWCIDYCCGEPASCDVVCRNNSKFVDYVREVGGFDLNVIPRSPQLPELSIPPVVPLLFHGNSRSQPLRTPAVALPFARMFDRRTGEVRFGTRSELCDAFLVDPKAMIILSGTDSDPPIEKWWGIGREKRRRAIRDLKELGIAAATSPNYSLFVDQPRWDDLHAMKRIAMVHGEMLDEGISAALHVNGRTDTDFRRWAAYIRSRPEIQMVAYEFATGTGWAGRRHMHVEWLVDLALRVGRPLDLFVRGGIEVLPSLAEAFARVTFVDSTSFMKTVKRQRAAAAEYGKLVWSPSPTQVGEPIDALLDANVRAVIQWICRQLVGVKPQKMTA